MASQDMVTRMLECMVEAFLSKATKRAPQRHHHTVCRSKPLRGCPSSSVARDLRLTVRHQPPIVRSVKAGSNDDSVRARSHSACYRRIGSEALENVRSFDDVHTHYEEVGYESSTVNS